MNFIADIYFCNVRDHYTVLSVSASKTRILVPFVN